MKATLRAGLALALASCSGTEPAGTGGHEPANGRYAYQMSYAEGGVLLTFSGELTISAVSPTTLTHSWSVSGFAAAPPTIAIYDALLHWVLTASANGGARTVFTHLTRLQGGYACSTTIVGEINGVDQSFVGSCTLTYLGT
ncbi:MAG TPA: hypothetical protein VFN96_06475 [Gemmatimonadales bacterium]|nr:hypothetical protein [Gemmatimonadales bacterium]